ncbi:MAG: hypothetical protein CMH98_01055 [Oceanospirillaceae bacterium]|nr:hypothetical protein [Oceanospirillaceae bacterium]
MNIRGDVVIKEVAKIEGTKVTDQSQPHEMNEERPRKNRKAESGKLRLSSMQKIAEFEWG